jgi:hypothetical protein
MIAILDKLPLASIVTVIVAIVGGVIAILNPDVLSFQAYATSVGVTGGGMGVLGLARANSGKGLAK